MGTTNHEIALSIDDYLRVRIVSERGRGVIDFTIQYEAVIGDRTYPVIRYDTAHGQAHRDLLDAQGHNIDKLWFSHTYDYAAVVQLAIQDIRANWPQYRADFLRRIP